MKYKLLLPSKAHCFYQLQASSRAKYVRIKISPPDKITLVVPEHVDPKYAHAFIEEKIAWIEKSLQKFAHQPETGGRKIALPKQLRLNLTEETWQISYQKTSDSGLQLQVNAQDSQVILTGNIDVVEQVFYLLGEWLKNVARYVFPPMLDALSRECGMPYNRLTVRGQKTRWGSCSSKKNINLNYKLLFFPEPVVRYVLIHELCHTREMNHSRRFWSLVEQFDPDYKAHRGVLKKQSDHFLPAGF